MGFILEFIHVFVIFNKFLLIMKNVLEESVWHYCLFPFK